MDIQLHCRVVVCVTDLSDAMDADEVRPLRLLRKAFDKVLRKTWALSDTGRDRLSAETTRLFSNDITLQDISVFAGVDAEPEFLERAGQILDEHGIVVIQDLVPPP